MLMRTSGYVIAVNCSGINDIACIITKIAESAITKYLKYPFMGIDYEMDQKCMFSGIFMFMRFNMPFF